MIIPHISGVVPYNYTTGGAHLRCTPKHLLFHGREHDRMMINQWMEWGIESSDKATSMKSIPIATGRFHEEMIPMDIDPIPGS
jgi:hypothetical protein